MSSLSSSSLRKINIQKSKFNNYSITIDDNQIMIDDIQFTQVQDGLIQLKNAKLNDIQQTSQGYFYFKNTSAQVSHFKADDNNIQTYFLHFDGYFQQVQADSNNNKNLLIDDCIIQQTNKGGGIMIQDIQNALVSNSKINYNQGSEQGGGIQMIKCSKVILQDVEIIGNKAYLYGGGIYLKDTNLQLISCKVQFNSAIVGGGIRYLNSIIDDKVNQNDQSQVINNTAMVYGNNQCSLPKEMKIKYEQNGIDKIIIATSSSNQQLTKINFQLIDEEEEVVKLPNRLNTQLEDFNSLEISNYFNRFQLSQEKKKNLIQILQQDFDEFYQFNLFSDSDVLGQVQIQQKNSFSQYNYTDKYTHQLSKYILQSGYSNLLSNNSQNQIYQFQIQSQGNLFNIQVNLKFRKCIQGEIINKIGQDFYECYLCSNNTYSLADPYSNQLQNSCKECPYGAQSCYGSQIIPQQGYWIQENYPNIYYCLNTYDSCIYNTSTNTSCSEGYTGPLCESCRYHKNNSIGEIQYFSKKGKYKCAVCSNKISQRDEILLTVFLGLIFLGYLTYQISSNYKKKVIKMKLLYLKRGQMLYISNSLNSNEKSSFALKILISYMQIISVVFQLKIQTPGFTLPFQYFGTQNRVKNLFISGLLKIYYMFYPGIIQIVIGTISCKEFNGQKYVLNDLQFKCYDRQYNIFNYVFGLPLLILALIIPSLIFRKLVKSKEHIYQDPNIFISYGFYFSEFQLHIQPYTYLQFNKLDHLSQITAAVTILCLNILIKIQKLYPNCIPEIDDGRVNILRQTMNWKNLLLAFSKRSYKGVYSYTNQMKQQSQTDQAFINQDKIQFSPNKRMKLSIFKSQDQNLNNIQESEGILNTDRKLLTQDDNQFEYCQKQIQTDKDSSQIIGQEILNYNSVRAHYKLVQPGQQLKLLSSVSQIPDEIQQIFPNKTGEDQNNQKEKN
ncbi:transmembrane protein, putative (macronuclear) [Tetrahymena thermophila SB210]|uniref:Transmembrane protein, putative n=1 Tax=Tetrahymena thermophila (strain SB210) TaxID=312017 RepID=I7MA13_TETTS|nr:transmembrane protein, putative [Tetrahymena thermophila SB210]EAS03202.2 transmembrane protein, putative [Tetrahymena thermophila SB210]|eukprot:XP_001023447.2 transmembrane protein, putative [Tetrahymena thermophila SB210]